jgi:hypothetical protein
VAAVLPLYLTRSGPTPTPHDSSSSAPRPSITSAGPTTQAGIPAQDLGSWGGELFQDNGITARFILNLSNAGSPGSLTPVGTFDNQTGNCQGNVLFNGVTSNAVVDLNLETTQNPTGVCVSSSEVLVQLAPNGVALNLSIIVAGSVQGSPASPLATAVLEH